MAFPAFLRQNMCLVGMLVLAYAIFDAISKRELLQSGGKDNSEELPNAAHASLFVTYLRTSIVAIVGMFLTLFGFVLRSKFQKARLVDFTKHTRYDQYMKTKVRFADFNHRGCVGRTLNQTGSEGKSLEEKKKA